MPVSRTESEKVLVRKINGKRSAPFQVWGVQHSVREPWFKFIVTVWRKQRTRDASSLLKNLENEKTTDAIGVESVGSGVPGNFKHVGLEFRHPDKPIRNYLRALISRANRNQTPLIGLENSAYGRALEALYARLRDSPRQLEPSDAPHIHRDTLAAINKIIQEQHDCKPKKRNEFVNALILARTIESVETARTQGVKHVVFGWTHALDFHYHYGVPVNLVNHRGVRQPWLYSITKEWKERRKYNARLKAYRKYRPVLEALKQEAERYAQPDLDVVLRAA